MADDLIDVAFMARAVAPSVTLRDLTAEGIKREVATALALNVDGKSADYIEGLFDGAFANKQEAGPVFFGRVQ